MSRQRPTVVVRSKKAVGVQGAMCGKRSHLERGPSAVGVGEHRVDDALAPEHVPRLGGDPKGALCDEAGRHLLFAQTVQTPHVRMESHGELQRRTGRPVPRRWHRKCTAMLVRDTGIEPVTSSVSGKRSPAELIARGVHRRWRRESNPCARLCRPLPHHSATPPWGVDAQLHLRADDGIRTRDPHLGKVMRYQLRYIREAPGELVTRCEARR